MTEMKNKKKGCLPPGCLIALVPVFLFVFFIVNEVFYYAPLEILLGWIPYLLRIKEQISINPAWMWTSAIVFVLFVFTWHRTCKWFYARRRKVDPVDSSEPKSWRLRWTFASVAIILLLFVSGIALLSIVHQVNWIVRSDKPIFSMSGRESTDPLRYIESNLHHNHSVFKEYVRQNGTYPQGTISGENGRAMHGWVSQMLPAIEEYGYQREFEHKYKFDHDWDAPENLDVLKTKIGMLLPRFLPDRPKVDEYGRALSHYATNSRVIGPGPAMSPDEITDGHSTTILLGEVNRDFLPWGHPRNYRDPAVGLNVPGGFGGAHRDFTQFLFVDGAVHYINNNIDPAVLRALASPTAGDDPGDSSDWSLYESRWE